MSRTPKTGNWFVTRATVVDTSTPHKIASTPSSRAPSLWPQKRRRPPEWWHRVWSATNCLPAIRPSRHPVSVRSDTIFHLLSCSTLNCYSSIRRFPKLSLIDRHASALNICRPPSLTALDDSPVPPPGAAAGSARSLVFIRDTSDCPLARAMLIHPPPPPPPPAADSTTSTTTTSLAYSRHAARSPTPWSSSDWSDRIEGSLGHPSPPSAGVPLRARAERWNEAGKARALCAGRRERAGEVHTVGREGGRRGETGAVGLWGDQTGRGWTQNVKPAIFWSVQRVFSS